MLYLWLKYIHILSSTLIFGAGLGSAFYMFQANRTGNIQAIAFAIRNVVLADWAFTTPSVIVQPLTGFMMMYVAHYPWSISWLWLSLDLYIIAGVCWLPVVWLQIQMRNMVTNALENNELLPKLYYQYFGIWFFLAWPAFIAVIIIFYLMIFKPL